MKQKTYISVMGTLGCGKTTAARLIAQEFHFHLLEEQFGENAFLPRFYKDMKRWAFHSQTFFLMEKITQMMETRTILTKESVVQDTPIQQDVFSYAKAQYVLGNIDEAEWRLYQKIYTSFESSIPKPNLIIFLDSSIPVIIKRIESRGRGYEKAIPKNYLSLLDTLNRKWLESNTKIPVLTIPTDTLDVVRSKEARNILLATIASKLRI
jgi:deoxyadenosine/deoxycytidine kinase